MKLVFCLTGRTYTSDFLLAWTDLVMQTASRGHQVIVSQQPSRSMCVSPVLGSEYDSVMFIGSDILFRPEDFLSLIESPHDVTTGLYLKAPTYSSSEPEFDGVGLGPMNIGTEQYVPVSGASCGFLLVSKEFLESKDASFWDSDHITGDFHADTTIRVGHRVEIVI